jgi:hypothetical protein
LLQPRTVHVPPQVHLDQIFRQGRDSAIVAGAHRVMHGRHPVAGDAPSSTHAEMSHWDNLITSSSNSSSSSSNVSDAYSNGASGGRSIGAAGADQGAEVEGGLLELGMGELLDRLGAARLDPSQLPQLATRKQHNPIQPLMPTASEGDDEGDEQGSGGGGGSEGLSHRMLRRIRDQLGSDGIVVAEHVQELQVPQRVQDVVQLLVMAGVDVSSDVQVLSATKETHAGTFALNRVLQPIMNPSYAAAGVSGQRVAHGTARLAYRVGDRVVQVRAINRCCILSPWSEWEIEWCSVCCAYVVVGGWCWELSARRLQHWLWLGVCTRPATSP